MKPENIYVGLDIGTTKTCATVVRKTDNDEIELIGVGLAPSTGIRKGVVINIDATVKSIKEAVSNAERMAGVSIRNVTVGIAGGHIKSLNSKGIIAVKNREVTQKDVDRVIESASAVDIPIGSEVLHVLPQQYTLDGQTDIRNPIGMTGVRLEVDVHIITGAVSSAQNIIKSCERAGLVVDDIVLEQLASAEAVLSDSEKELGVCLIDGGGGTTDLIIFKKGTVYHTAVLQLGGQSCTSDLAIGINAPESDAEKIKKDYGCVWPPFVSEDEVIEVPSVGGRPPRKVSKSVVTQILHARCEEILQMFLGELYKKKFYDMVRAGIVFTGGMSNIYGLEELAHSIFNLPVRIAKPDKIKTGLVDTINDPMYSTSVGLALIAAKKGHPKVPGFKGTDEKQIGKIFDTMKSWIKEFF
ncbi:MAG: cell division protein FtsA [Deferribacterales bacterium]